MLVAVGSTNPTKAAPVRDIFRRYYKNISVRSVAVESGVADQPVSLEEMFRGALNRARSALSAVPRAHFGVGIEGGLQENSFGWMEQSLVVITDRRGRIGVGASGGLVLPDAVMLEIRKGKTLEQAIDMLFGTDKIGRGIGMFGVFTRGVVTRTGGVSHGVAFALARFLNAPLYDRTPPAAGRRSKPVVRRK
ncbi:hypothetical protein A2Z33_06560 [Candidatus Gottesmanbacteria bacterium RBG_16_52_11]|uniref:Probable inosine/xanthosine triphosphatase n=1 Tax=Candidatus Gottesmanbacteria bacterium RBG_16_52_11 TaxID=1798374 RepID=A0A1F5YXK0_9BACT|nr:MAG: hypothetical protein A2Z33_06560 [Candidatus Gottesmanbacteria bacterium RBG_16_52_11]